MGVIFLEIVTMVAVSRVVLRDERCFEKQFPYTPNVRGVRTDRYKYIRYPHGDGGEDRHMAELYDLQADPEETSNLISRPEHAQTIRNLSAELDRLMKAADAIPDKMPLDEGIKSGLPDQATRRCGKWYTSQESWRSSKWRIQSTNDGCEMPWRPEPWPPI